MPSGEYNLYLISDATGETLDAVAQAACAQFPGAKPNMHMRTLVRAPHQVKAIVEEIRRAPGLVMFTLVSRELRDLLFSYCQDLNVPCISILGHVITSLGGFLGVESRELPGQQHILDARYFRRIEAINFTLAHDDGLLSDDLSHAEVVLVGVSRTSKTPTCIYLANRGIKAANVPLIPDVPAPAGLENLPGTLPGTLIVGLTVHHERLTQIRRNRLLSLNQEPTTDYVDTEAVKKELRHARRLFGEKGWPVIDVTRRSIEETAAAIMSLLTD